MPFADGAAPVMTMKLPERAAVYRGCEDGREASPPQPATMAIRGPSILPGLAEWLTSADSVIAGTVELRREVSGRQMLFDFSAIRQVKNRSAFKVARSIIIFDYVPTYANYLTGILTVKTMIEG